MKRLILKRASCIVRGALPAVLLTLGAVLFTLAAGDSMAQAQTRIPRELHFGVVGGANLSKYSFAPTVTQQMTQGYTAGVAVRYIEETFFGLQGELLLTQRGFTDYYEDHEDWSYQRKLTYVEMPIMAHVYFKMGSRHEVAFDAGPKLGLFMGESSTSALPDDFGQSGSETENYTSAHHRLATSKKFDYGIQAGLGYEFKFNNKMSLQIQGRYYYGLGNLWPDSKSDDFEQSSNSSIQIVMALWWHHTIRGRKVLRSESGLSERH